MTRALRRPWTLSLGLVVLVVVAVVAWRTSTARTAARVSSSWTLQCPPGLRVDTGRTSTITVQPGWRCTVVLRIQNDAGRAVRVSRVEAPYTGPGNGVLLGHSTTGARFRPVPDEPGDPPELLSEALDGEYVVDRTIRAHSSSTVALGVGEPRRLCMGAGVTSGLPDWPVVVLSTGHRTFHRPTRQEVAVHYVREVAQDCPEE